MMYRVRRSHKPNPFKTAKAKRKKGKSNLTSKKAKARLKKTSQRSGDVMRMVGKMLSSPKKVKVIEPKREKIGRFAK